MIQSQDPDSLRSVDEKREWESIVFTSAIVPALMCKSFEECHFLLSLCLDTIITWPCPSNQPDSSGLLGAVEIVPPTKEESPGRVGFTVAPMTYYYCVAVFHGPWKEIAQGWASTTALGKATGVFWMNCTKHTGLLQDVSLDLPETLWQTLRPHK